MLKLYIISFLALNSIVGSAPDGAFGNCDSMEVEIAVENSSRDITKSKVTVSVKGGKAPIYYVFYRPSGHLLSKNMESNSVDELSKGVYFCSVVDAEGCTKKIELKVD